MGSLTYEEEAFMEGEEDIRESGWSRVRTVRAWQSSHPLPTI